MHFDGKHESLKKIKMIPKSFWISKKTKEKYPIKWKIEIPERKIILDVVAMVKNQEVVAGPAHYWEGPINVKGVVNGKKVKGQGFMELVSHASPYGKFSFEGIRQLINQILEK